MIDKTSLSHITQGPLQIKIEIEKWMDGGGLTFGQEVADVVKHLFPNKTHDSCLDWCSGPGTIGFELLGRGLINNLVLMDINGEVIKRAKKIIKDNNIADRVKAITSFSCQFLPKDITYDLIVSNPPHFHKLDNISFYNGEYTVVNNEIRRKAEDKGWNIHRDFCRFIKSKLRPDGHIIWQENSKGSSTKDFEHMIDYYDLKITDSFKFNIPNMYYIVITHK